MFPHPVRRESRRVFRSRWARSVRISPWSECSCHGQDSIIERTEHCCW